MGRPSKKSTKIFVDAVSKMLIEKGAVAKGVDTLTDFSEFELPTEVGKLTIRLDTVDQFIWTVFSRFEEVDRAKEIYPCNQFSGKYNIHLTDSMSPMEAFREVEKFYKNIT